MKRKEHQALIELILASKSALYSLGFYLRNGFDKDTCKVHIERLDDALEIIDPFDLVDETLLKPPHNPTIGKDK